MAKDLTWSCKRGTLTFSGHGAMPDCYNPRTHVCVETPWSHSAGIAKRIVVDEGITHIGSFAFQNCSNVTKITLPSTLVSIGYVAFRHDSCYSVEIPHGVKSIGPFAFRGNLGFVNITIPASVEELGKGCFADCKMLKSVTFKGDVASIGDHAFTDCYILKKIVFEGKVGKIGRRALSECESLKEIVFGGTMEEWNALGYLRLNFDTVVHCTDGDVKY